MCTHATAAVTTADPLIAAANTYYDMLCSLLQALEELAAMQAAELASQQHQEQQQQEEQQQQQQQEVDSVAIDAADLFSVPISIGGAAYSADIQPGESITAAAQRFCATHAQDLQRYVRASSSSSIVRIKCRSVLVKSTV
jgi:ABC-type transport system involved in cytochrome bd biosynthesis fused ATPase/permease subunit